MSTHSFLLNHARALSTVLGNVRAIVRGAVARAALLVLAGAALSACGGGSGGGIPFLPVTAPAQPAPPTPSATYPISATVTGLKGGGLVLQNNAGDDLPVAADGTVRFATPSASGARYAVTVKVQPGNPTQTCTVNNASGTVADAAIDNVAVVCSTNSFRVSGTVAGLAGGGLVLQNNAADDLVISADGTFAFAAPVASGAGYAVTVKTQPMGPSQTCTVSNASGTVVDVAIASVTVVCSVNSYRVGGMVSGLVGAGLVLQNNAADDLVISVDGDFEFTAPVASAADYAVTVKTQPTSPSQTCTVNNSSGPVVDAAVKTVKVICQTNSYTVGGTISGLWGRGLVLQNNAGDDIALSYLLDGTFSFATPVASGARYSVTVKTQPQFLNQVCTVSNDSGSGTVASAAVTSVAITCKNSAPTPSPMPARFAYVVNRDSTTVSAYVIDAATGALSPMTVPTVTTGNGPVSITVDPTGRFAYVANFYPNTVSAYTINVVTGALSPMAVPTVATGVFPTSVTVDPTGRFAYVANSGSYTVSTYSIDTATGALIPTAVPTVATGNHPHAVAVDPTGRFAYVVNHYSNTVSAYAIDAVTGALSPMAGPTVTTGNGPYSIAVDPTGRFAYVANLMSNTVSAYAIDAVTGALSPTAVPTVATGNHPHAVAVDPTGRFVYVADPISNTVSAYAINVDTGALSPTVGPTVSPGSNPSSVTVDPTGRFAYVLNSGDFDSVSTYAIDAGSGALSLKATVAAGVHIYPGAIALAR